MRTPGLLFLLVSLAGCRQLATEPVIPDAGPLLDSARVRDLPAGDRQQWHAYLVVSAAAAAADSAAMAAELAALGRSTWNPSPAGADFTLTASMTPAWFATPAAAQLADVIVSYQAPCGGWSKAVDYSAGPRRPGDSYGSQASWSWIATFDNGATTGQLRFLAAIVSAQARVAHLAAFRRGLAYLDHAQFPNGCWPQSWPLEGSYHDAVTFNDDVIVNVLGVLAAAARGDYPFLDSAERSAAAAALNRGITCVAAAQVKTSAGRAWGQQHDPLTLRPVPARAYEPAALASLETARVVDLLLQLPAPGADVLAAVHAAAAWLRDKAEYGYAYEAGELVARTSAGPLWARLYELEGGRAIFGDRDGSVHYDVRELSAERRANYAWYTTYPGGTLARYQAWAATHPQ